MSKNRTCSFRKILSKHNLCMFSIFQNADVLFSSISRLEQWSPWAKAGGVCGERAKVGGGLLFGAHFIICELYRLPWLAACVCSRSVPVFCMRHSEFSPCSARVEVYLLMLIPQYFVVWYYVLNIDTTW